MQGHQVGPAVQAGQGFCQDTGRDPFLRRGGGGYRARAAAGAGHRRSGRLRGWRGQPYLHLWRAGRVLHGRGLHGHGRGHGCRRKLVQGPLRHPGHFKGETAAPCQRQGCDPAPDRHDRGGRRAVQVAGICRGGRGVAVHGRSLYHCQHGH